MRARVGVEATGGVLVRVEGRAGVKAECAYRDYDFVSDTYRQHKDETR